MGNTGSFDLTGVGASDTIIGYTNIRGTTVLFSTNGVGANPGGIDPDEDASATSAGRIWSVNTEAAIPQDTLTLIKNATGANAFNFTSQKPIFAVGRYENADVQKVYWVDDLNNMRFVNIADADVATQDVDQFDIIADVTFEMPVLSSMGSGSLGVGTVQYAYQLFNNNGAETTYSPASNLVHLARSGERLPTSNLYKGSPQLDDAGNANSSGKSVTMTISNIDTSFDQIKIVAIHYAQLNGTPSINVVAIRPAQATVLFTDDGTYTQGSVPFDVYRLLSQRLFTSRTLESKDNILFAGNITDRFWDIEYDARAYRFNDSQEGRIFEADGVTLEKLIDGASPLYPTAAGTGAELDAYNIMNDISLDAARTAGNSYRYQADGARLGGSGVNVAYTFEIYSEDRTRIDDSTANGTTGTFFLTSGFDDAITLSYETYASPYMSGTVRGYHRSEIYRLGLVLYDAKGRVSPVKWIGDIRMPDAYNSDSVTTYNNGVGNQTDFLTAFLHDDERTVMNVLGLDFSVTNLPDEVVSYQFVRVRRKASDRTVLAQGPIYQPALNGTDDIYMPSTPQLPPAHSDVTKSLSLIYSPEISVNKNLVVGGSDYIEMVVRAGTGATGPVGAVETEASPNILIPATGNIEKQRGYVSLNSDEYGTRSFDVTDGLLIPVGASGTSYNINTVDFTNYNYPALESFGGTVLAVNNPPAAYDQMVGLRKYIVNYRRPVTGYGGVSFEDRSVNEYIACSDVIPESDSSYFVYGGDTFIGFFDLQHMMWNLDIDGLTDSYWSVQYAVVESSINTELRDDDSFHRVYNVENSYLLQEEAGVHTNTTDTYNQERDLYSYNSVYSQENTAKTYLPISSDFSAQTKSDALIIASGVKTNGELVDSWTQFKENEEIEVDTRYGPLSKLLTFRNHLVFFQDNGVGTVGVNQQSLLSDIGNLPELSLGKGTVLDRYDYITIDSGCQQQEAVCSSAGGFYWYDTVKNKFTRYSGQMKNLSDVEGLFSYFNSNVPVSNDGRSDLLTGNQIISVFDDKYMESLYNFKRIMIGTIQSKDLTQGVWSFTVVFKDGSLEGITTGDAVILDGITVGDVTVDNGFTVTFVINEALYDSYSADEEIRIYFPESEGNFTLAYNELMDAFVYFPTYTPQSYIDTFSRYLSVVSDKSVYEHNRGFRSTFYGVTSPSTIQILVNPNGDVINVYNNAELMTEVINTSESNLLNETINSVRITNDYQDSGVISLVPGTNIKRRLRKWRFGIPREGTARIRDAHAKMLFSYTNADDKRFIFHDVITHFMPREF